MSRHGGSMKDIRSKIKHENANLGSGTGGLSQPPASTPNGIGAGNSNIVNNNLNPAFNYGRSNPPNNLGSGPSFVSLSPSDSISNYEGRSGHGYSQSRSSHLGEDIYARPPSPSSTASFAAAGEGMGSSARNDLISPLRPARSVRRPQQAPGFDSISLSSNLVSEKSVKGTSLMIPPVGSSRPGPSSPSRSGPGRDLLSGMREGEAGKPDRHTRSAQLMAEVARNGRGGRETPQSMISSADEAEDDIYGGLSPIDPPEDHRGFKRVSHRISHVPQTLGSLTHANEPAALNNVLSALSAAGRKHQAARIMRGTTAEEETRRRKNERKIEDVKGNRRRPVEEYMNREDERSFRQINAVLRKVKAEWPFIADDDFNSVALALSMLDESSLGSNRNEFEEMKHLIESSLQGTVDDHYESFATAITLHNNVLTSLGAAQNSVSGARRRLRDSREALGAKRADLVQMWHRSQAVKESLRLLDLVEHLKGVPDRLESLMSEKRFLQAVNLLVRSLKTIDKPEVAEVGATADLRAYLKGQEQAMLEILIEELHNHLYLKSYFCDSRWKSYVSGQEDMPNVDFGRDYNGEALASGDGVELSPVMDSDSNKNLVGRDKALKLTRYLQSLSTRPTFDPNLALASDIHDTGLPSTTSMSALTGEVAGSAGMTISKSTDSNIASMAGNLGGSGFDVGADFEQNPEADSFLYIEMLLESLARLGKLGLALEIVSQRLTIEVHQLVDATIDEVDARNEPMRRSSVALRPESILLASSSAMARSFAESLRGSRSSFSVGNRPVSSMLRISAGESNALIRDGETMRDLFWTLFSKLDAVLQGHRVVYEVAGMITSRPGFKDPVATKKVSGVKSLIEIWKPIQSEVRTLLHDYLMDDEQSSSSRNAIISVNDVLRDGRFGRDRSKQLFKLSDSGVKPGRRDNAILRRHEDALTASLRASVPGLVSSIEGPAGSSHQSRHNQVVVSSTRSDEQYAGAGHRLLVKPDAFNVSVLFQPALAFIQRVEQVMPSEAAGETSKGFSAFLDEFVQDVFLAQLEDKVRSLFQSAVGGQDAFQEDPASRSASTRPIVKSAANIVVLIDSLYSMLRATPFHRESYSRLIISTIVQYYQRCNERFRDLTNTDVSSDGTSGSVRLMLSAEWAQRPEINACLVELCRAGLTPARKKELQSQENRLETQLASKRPPIGVHDLITSRKKLMALGNLHHSLQWFLNNISRLKATDESVPTSSRPTARLSVVGGSSPDQPVEEELKLPLGKDMADRYDALPNVYRHLSNVILFTLRIELRARAIHHLDLAVSDGNYVVNDSSVEPSPHIVDLNSEIANFDDIFADTVTPEQKQFLFDGLASLMDSLLVSCVRKVRAINRQGVTKMIRNILALQQNLKNIVDMPLEVDFERSKRFWESVAKEPSEMVEGIKSAPHGTKHSFEEYRSALCLMLGLENSNPSSSSVSNNVPPTPKTPTAGGPGQVPGAGTVNTNGSKEISRQKFNEYLIDLHEFVGDTD
ncbi:hypothetical protein IE53DRAFT_323094 [Violaceomyces palustris]|uniref:Uncharacterized protein n=1 Tax=Violaceomyces palustris TaxID=1673888 RepID=A0ACD0P8H7_9BASI|nr:hypothetical protein IE53DRAFT_323094 [Violaceomyces palustris]